MQPLLGPGVGTDVLCTVHNEGWKWITPGSGFQGVTAQSQPHFVPGNYDSSPAAMEKTCAY